MPPPPIPSVLRCGVCQDQHLTHARAKPAIGVCRPARLAQVSPWTHSSLRVILCLGPVCADIAVRKFSDYYLLSHAYLVLVVYM